MKNFNLKYECLDERDDYHAQLRDGMVLVPSWNENVATSAEFDKFDHLPTAHDGFEEYLEQLSFGEEDMLIDGVLERKMARYPKGIGFSWVDDRTSSRYASGYRTYRASTKSR